MRTSHSLFALLVSGALLLPSGVVSVQALADPLNETQLLARGGGRAGGGNRMGSGGRATSRPAGGHSGFKNAGAGLNSGSRKPTGGWSSKAPASGGPSLDRASRERATGSGQRIGDRQTDRTDRQANRTEQRGDRQANRTDRVEARSDVRSDRIDARTDRMDRRWDSYDRMWNNYPGWARPGWGYARPWNYGWYGGWATPTWGWWGARAAAWGITSLATAAIINEAVDDAVDDHIAYITVPNSDYGLLYGTVSPTSTDNISFEVIANNSAVTMTADCRDGTLNGRDPSTAAEAQLLNAACQVAYGST